MAITKVPGNVQVDTARVRMSKTVQPADVANISDSLQRQIYTLSGSIDNLSAAASSGTTPVDTSGFSVDIGAAQFFGTGLNDLVSGGAWTSIAANAQFVITINATGTPDHFKWSKNGGTLSGSTAITGTAQALSDGVSITFAATTGHTIGNIWVVDAISTSGDAPATVTPIVSPSGAPTTIGGFAGARFRSVQDVLRDTISLTDYCLGDGVTIDTAGLIFAVAAIRDRAVAPGALGNGCTLVIPPGDFLFDAPIIFDRFTGLCVKGSGSQSILRWAGASGDGPAIQVIGCFKALFEDFEIIVNAGSGLGHVVAIQEYVPGGAPATISTKHQWRNVRVTSLGADCLAAFMVGTPVNASGAPGADFNNDYHFFSNVVCTGFLDSGWWLMGSQAYSNAFQNCTVDGFFFTAGGLFGLYCKHLVKATGVRGGFIASASWVAGVATYHTTQPHGLSTGAVASAGCHPFNWDIFSRSGVDPTITVVNATTFTLPMAVDPTGSPFENGTWWQGALGAATFRWYGGGGDSCTADFFIDGYSGEPYLVSGADIESTGKLLLAVNGAIRMITIAQTRWAREQSTTCVLDHPSDTDFVSVEGGALKLESIIAYAGGPGFTGGPGNVYEDLTIQYHPFGIVQANLTVLDCVFATSKITAATFFHDDVSSFETPDLYLTKRNMQWQGVDGGITNGWFDNTRVYSPPDSGAPSNPVTTPLLTAAQLVPFEFISTATWAAGVATYTTIDKAAGFRNGETIDVQGLLPVGYNVTGTITVIDDLHFSIPVAVNPGVNTRGGEGFRIDDPANYTTTIARFGVSSGGFVPGTGAYVAPVEIGTGSGSEFPVFDIGDQLKGLIGSATPNGSGETALGFAQRQLSIGLNDLSSSGLWTMDTAAHTITVAITSAGTPDIFKWQLDSGQWFVGTSITGAAQALLGGVSVTFGATTGHTEATAWTIAIASATGVVSAPLLLRNGQVFRPDFFGLDTRGWAFLKPVPFASLSGMPSGSWAVMSDSPSNGFGDSIAAGGGPYEVLVYSDGTAIIVFGGGAGVHVSTSDPVIANLQAQITSLSAGKANLGAITSGPSAGAAHTHTQN